MQSICKSVTLAHISCGVRKLRIGYADGQFTLTELQDQTGLAEGAAILIGLVVDDPLVPCFDGYEMARRNDLAIMAAIRKGD